MSDCKRGHWIKGRAWSEGHGMGEEYGFYYTCTECGKEIKGNYDKCYSVFCPECGSRNRRMPETEEKPQNVTVGNVVPAMNKAEDGAVSREAVLKKARFYFNRGAAVEMVPADYVRRLPEVSPEAEVINKIKELIAEEIDNSRKRSWAAKQEYREGLAAAIGIIDKHRKERRNEDTR